MKKMLLNRLAVGIGAFLLLFFCCTTRVAAQTTKQISLQQLIQQLHDKRHMNFAWNEQGDTQIKVPESLLSKNDAEITTFLEKLLKEKGFNLSKISDRQYVITKTQEEKPAQQLITPVSKELQITGRVRDLLGVPLPGVRVTAINKAVSAITDADGNYHIETVKGDSLRFDYIGFISQSFIIKDRIEIDVNLEASTTGLNEVVVVGYGQQKKISQVGAQSTVNVEELKQPVANLTTVISGKIAGIIGVQRSGEPGYDNANIWIRGISTFTNSGPLILVDGVERSFNNIDPQDIASFSILKDASATAVYGVRGANGVILIQTKKGKVGKPVIDVNYNQGFTQFTQTPQFVDGPTYLKLANEAYANSNPGSMPLYSQERIDATIKGTDPDLYPNTDWIKAVFNHYGYNRKANVNVNGGAPNAKYYLSIGYYDEKGLFKTDELAKYNSAIKFSRYNFTSNLSVDLTPTTKVDFGASGWVGLGNYPGTGTGDIWNNIFMSTPVAMPAIYSNGYAPVTRNGFGSPYIALTQTGYATDNTNQLWSNIRATQDLSFWLKGLSATAMFSFDTYNSHTIRRTKSVDGYLATGRENGILQFDQINVGSSYLGYSRENGGNRQLYTEASINYLNKFGDKHDVSGLLLFNRSDYVDAFAGSFISSIPYRNQGIAGRVTYGYDTRYLAELNFGYNGAENFAPSRRYGFFPSFGVGWIVSNEQFFKPVTQVIDFLKLRGSYGLVGNNKIGDFRFAYIAQVGGGNGGYAYGNHNNYNYDGLDISEYAVNVGWETAKKSNLGVELKMFKSALSLTVDYFQENRENIFLRRADVPSYVGLINNPYGNLGIVHNRGVDGTVEFDKKITTALSIGFRGNFTYNKAIVIDDANSNYPYPWQQHIGRKLNQRFGYIALGLFSSKEEIANSPLQSGEVKPGDIKYKDLNGDGKIDAYDQGPIGNTGIPAVVYGFGTNITWKRFSIGAFFKGAAKVDIALNGEGFQPFQQAGNRGNVLSQVQDHWSVSNPDPHAIYPRLTYPSNTNMNYEFSTWWLKNGSFLRLQTVEASYNLPTAHWMTKAGFGSARIYFSGYNLATISSFKFWDPELGDGKGASYPLIKTFNLGFELSFK